MTTLKKIIHFVREAWIMLGIAIFLLVVIEVGLLLVSHLRDFEHSPHPAFRAGADTYAGAPWAIPYFDEYERKLGPTRWVSYVYWRHTPFSGNYINIDSDGIRKTYSYTLSEGASPKMKVFMFGGSTMWGTGARDDFTIPSFFAKEAESKRINCEVVNFGEHAYVSTQEVITLMLQLQKGNIPDVVIFYDGANDTFGAFQLGLAGLPQNEYNREKEFNILQKKEINTLAIQNAARQLSIVRFFYQLLTKLGVKSQSTIPLEYEKPVADRSLLAREVVETYISNMKLVQTLSKTYGFKYLFYWQPMIYQKKQLTDYERQSVEYHNYPGMIDFYNETYALMQKRAADLKNDQGVHDLSLIFSNVDEPIYLDWCHLGEKGNSIIAQRMAGDFARLVNVNDKSAAQGKADR